MNRVVNAIQEGRCSIAVSGSLLRDPDVMLELTRRGALSPMALSGPTVSPLVPVGDAGLARSLANPNGVIVLVDPQSEDSSGMADLARIVGRSPNTPTVLVVARTFNPLLYAMSFRGVAVAHIKDRGKRFVANLPSPEGEAAAPAPTLPKAKRARESHPGAPRFHFVGRDEEMAQLTGILGEGGPVALTGPEGVGRTWLLAHAAAEGGLRLHPEVILGRSTGFDALAARLAYICGDAGERGLGEALRAKEPPLAIVAKAIETLQAAEGAAGQVLVVRNLDFVTGRSGDFFRKSRLEILVRELMRNTYALRIVFVGHNQPRFFKEGEDTHLRRMELGGVMGKHLHEIFAAYKAPEFPREQFGPLNDKLHGHPMAARAFAIAMREAEDGVALLEDPRFLRLEDVGDTKAMLRHLRRRVDKLADKARATLAMLAHFRHPLPGALLAELGLGRRDRLAMLAQGLLDMVGTENDRAYRVHPLVRRCLPLRDITQFDSLQRAADLYIRLARDAEGAIRLAWNQEANACLVAARRLRNLVPLPFPDADALVDSALDMMRMRSPRFDLAELRLDEVLGVDVVNTDAWLALVELKQRAKADKDDIQATYDEALAQAPVPELYHQLANWHLSRRARSQAITALEGAIELMPLESRLRTRVASLMLQSGRRREGLEQLHIAMEQEPMLPDAYGLMGQAKRMEGRQTLGEAETLLREAVRLAPGDPVQVSRLVGLLVDLSLVDEERRAALREEAQELLDAQIKGDPTADTYMLFARVLRLEGTDLERCEWLLKKAKKALGRRERSSRLTVEGALLDLARGNLDAAEKAVRDLVEREPSNHEVFSALAQVLEARGLLIPAHAEYLRAQERTSPVSLARESYDAQLARLQALIEAQAAGLLPQEVVEVPEVAAPIDPAAAHSHNRVIRRRRGEPDAAVQDAAEASSEAADEAPVAAGTEAEDAAPVEAAAEE